MGREGNLGGGPLSVSEQRIFERSHVQQKRGCGRVPFLKALPVRHLCLLGASQLFCSFCQAQPSSAPSTKAAQTGCGFHRQKNLLFMFWVLFRLGLCTLRHGV